MSAAEPLLTIGQVAARAGVRASSIRYYEQVGVLPPARRVSGQRRYGSDVLQRLAIIDVAQRAGFTLDEIRSLTGPENRDAHAGERIQQIARDKVAHLDALIERAAAVRRWLIAAESCDCQTVDVCSLFVDPLLAPPAKADASPPQSALRDPLRRP